MKKKLLSIMLLLCLCLIPAQAWAAVDGGDVTDTGLQLSAGLPTEETTYTAGSGTITFTPATDTANAKLTLNNATIDSIAANANAILLPQSYESDIDIDLIGDNRLCGVSAIVNTGERSTLTINGSDSSSLWLEGDDHDAVAYQSDIDIKGGSYIIVSTYSGGMTVVGNLKIEDNANVDISTNSNQISDYSLYTGGNLTVDDSYLSVTEYNTKATALKIGGTINLQSAADVSVKSNKEITVTKPINIDKTSQFELCNGTTLTLDSTDDNTGSINNKGKFYNNGIIMLTVADHNAYDSISAQIAALNLSGTGVVKTHMYMSPYANDGTRVNWRENVQIESDRTTDNESSLTSGIRWIKETQTLELKNAQIVNLCIPNDITLLIHGSVMIDNIILESSGSLVADKMLTIKSADDDAHLYSNGIITMNDSGLTITDLTAELTYLTISNTTQPFNIVKSNVTFFAGLSYMANYNPAGGDETTVDYGLNLTNSNVTVRGGYYPMGSTATYNDVLWVERITLDKKSSLTLDGAEIHNYGYMPESMSKLKNYIPKGYSIGHYTSLDDDGTPHEDESVTVLDKNGNYARYFTMKHRSTGGNSNSSTSYTITATAGDGGSISPKGSVSASKGTDSTFTVTAKDGYKIADVLVDGKSVGAVDEYTFKDISASHTIKATFKATGGFALNKDDHTAYVTGYDDGTVRPNANITRAETATMLYRLLTDERMAEIKTTKHSFNDIPNGAWYTEAVATMSNGGYITGYEDNTFRGNNNITRAEFVTMLVRFIKVEDADCSFTDVPKAHWAYSYIATAAANEWLTGYEDGTFRPEQAISRAEAMAIINRVLERGVNADGLLANHKNFTDNSTSDWYYYEVIEATNSHDYNGKRPSESWTALNN